MSTAHFRWLLKVSVLSLWICFATPIILAENISPPIVSKVQGRVFFMPREETLWIPLKKDMKIPIGSLIQVTENSALKYSYTETSGSLSVAVISTPSVFRLTGDEIRPTMMQSLIIDKDKLEDVKRLQSRNTAPPEYNIPIPYAWKRFTFLLAPEVAQYLASTVNFGKEKSKSAEIGGYRTDYGLRLINPHDRMTVDSKLWPGLVLVKWKDLKKAQETSSSYAKEPRGNKFHIYLWRDGTNRPALPIAITTSDSHRIMVSEPGRWKIQVEKVSDDLKAISSSQQTIVNIVSNNPTAGLNDPLRKDATKEAEVIKPLYPQDGFTHMIDKLPIRVDFAWETKVGLATGERYVFEIISGRQTKPQRYLTDRLTIPLQLKRQETYKWRVGIAKAGENEPQNMSKWQTISIKQIANDPLRELLSKSEGGAIYLENGL